MFEIVFLGWLMVFFYFHKSIVFFVEGFMLLTFLSVRNTVSLFIVSYSQKAKVIVKCNIFCKFSKAKMRIKK